MAGEAAAGLATVQLVQTVLSIFESTLTFGSYLCPVTPTIDTITTTSFDYIIVGGGTAGSVLANRLSANLNLNILLLEAGGCPPLESDCLGYFTLQPQTAYDYNMTSVNDGYTCQNLQGGVVGLTAGKMLGGSSSIHHGIWVRGSEAEYDAWATAADDDSWSYAGLLPYFIKSENVNDAEIIKENGTYCGTSGPTILQRQHSSENDIVLKALAEQGYNILNNMNADIPLGAGEPLISLGDKQRQSSLVSYISPVKDRSNLYVLTGATVNKINFSGTVATGVTFTYSDASYTVTANREVILSAGAIKTPQLLMLSGIGPSDHLIEKGITVIRNLPVGKNLQDHPSASILIGLEEDTTAAPAPNPYEFPVPVTCNYDNLADKDANYAQVQSINLVFYNGASGLVQLCMNAFKYSADICDAMYAANIGRKVMWRVTNVLHPESRGEILLNTTDVNDQPLVTLGLLSEESDLVLLAKFLAQSADIVNTTTFKNIGAEFFDLGLCTDQVRFSAEYWECYALAMSSTMWHYSGTAALGTVVDTNLLVRGVSRLRVVDASVFPMVPGGNINAAVLAVAEKIADVILSGLS